jgi:hypothetical protein
MGETPRPGCAQEFDQEGRWQISEPDQDCHRKIPMPVRVKGGPPISLSSRQPAETASDIDLLVLELTRRMAGRAWVRRCSGPVGAGANKNPEAKTRKRCRPRVSVLYRQTGRGKPRPTLIGVLQAKRITACAPRRYPPPCRCHGTPGTARSWSSQHCAGHRTNRRCLPCGLSPWWCRGKSSTLR